MATYTIYAASNGTNAYGLASQSNLWTTARSGGPLVTVTDTTAVDVLNEYFFDTKLGSDFAVAVESFYQFDTSIIPDLDVVTAAVISIASRAFGREHTVAWDIEAWSYDFGGTVTTADWVPGGSFGAMTKLASLPESSWVEVDFAYNALTSTGSFPGAVNKAGYTRLLLCGSVLRTQTTNPTKPWLTRVIYYTMLGTGAAFSPKLVVETEDGPTCTLVEAWNDDSDSTYLGQDGV